MILDVPRGYFAESPRCTAAIFSYAIQTGGKTERGPRKREWGYILEIKFLINGG